MFAPKSVVSSINKNRKTKQNNDKQINKLIIIKSFHLQKQKCENTLKYIFIYIMCTS